MKNVLFIVYYFPPMGGSGVQRPLKFVKYLREFGWNPIVLCPEPGMYSVFDESLENELREINPEIIRVPSKTPFHVASNNEKNRQVELPESVSKLLRRATRLFMYPDNKKGWIEPAVKKGLEVINSHPIDLIFSTAPPFSNHIIGSTLSKEANLPLVLDYRDAWLQNHFFSGMFGWQKKIMHKMEAQCLTTADAITVLDSFILKEMDNLFPDLIKKAKVLPHGFDQDDLNNTGKSNLQYKTNKLNVLYSGLFYEQNQPDIFLKGIRLGLDEGLFKKDDMHLHFQGGLSKRISKMISRLNLSDIVTDYGYLNHDVAAANISKADLLWMISNFNKAYKQVKSGKLFEYFGTHKPILGLVNPGVEADLLTNYGAGFIADVTSPKSVSDEISKISGKHKRKEEIPSNIEFVEQFNRKAISSHLSDLFNDLLLQLNKNSSRFSA